VQIAALKTAKRPIGRLAILALSSLHLNFYTPVSDSQAQHV
jgi:hypothetical protein